MEWVLRDKHGAPAMLFHGSRDDISAFDSTRARDGCLHFGTAEQATMRCKGPGANLVPVFLLAERVKRVRDRGGSWGAVMKRATSGGFDAIVYLNRYEGIQLRSLEQALEAGVDPDKISDNDFRAWFPEARDSYLVPSAEQVVMAIPAPIGGAAFRAAYMRYLLIRNEQEDSRTERQEMRRQARFA